LLKQLLRVLEGIWWT